MRPIADGPTDDSEPSDAEPTGQIASLRVAIVHEWLDHTTGSEKTFVEMARALPNADLFALTLNPSVDFGLDREVTTTVLDRPWLRDHRGLTLGFMPVAWRMLKPDSYDVVITSSHAFSKGFPAARAALHMNYCYTPMRYAWYPQLDQRTAKMSGVSRHLGAPLRAMDRRDARLVDRFAGISSEVCERIRECYGRDAVRIYPPVDVEFFKPTPEVPREDFFLAFSRLVKYKRIDLAIEAVLQAGEKIVVAGAGPEMENLRNRFGGSKRVTFLGRVGDEELRSLYQRCRALVFPSHEDFGIIPVEAQACGTPVIGLARGGSRDTIIDGTTGALVQEATVEAFSTAVRDLVDDATQFDWSACVAHAATFGVDRFHGQIRDWILEAVASSGDS